MASAGEQAGIALAIIGLLLAAGAGLGYASCSSASGGSAGACTGLAVGAGLGVLLLIAGIALAVSASRTYTYVAPSSNPSVPPPIVTPVVIQQDVVRVRCRYCGALGDPRSGKCSNCGAPL